MNPLLGLVPVFSSYWLWGVVVVLGSGFAWFVNGALVLGLLGGLAGAVAWVPDLGPEASTLILFLAILPILNGVFDVLSMGLTRWLSRRGAVSTGGGALAWALGDLASAVVSFGLYGLVLGVLAAFPHAGEGYLCLFEDYAARLGAPITPICPAWLP